MVPGENEETVIEVILLKFVEDPYLNWAKSLALKALFQFLQRITLLTLNCHCIGAEIYKSSCHKPYHKVYVFDSFTKQK